MNWKLKGCRTPASRSVSAALFLVPLLVAGACAGVEERSVPPEPAVHSDSAGVAVSVFPAGLPRAAVRLEPEIVIGEDESRPGHLLHVARGARELSDGTIVVLDVGSGEIRLFDPEGELLERFGRQGDGPEEFRLPSGTALLAGDSIGVTTRRGEYRVFARDGSFGRGGWVGRAPTAQEASFMPGGPGVGLHGILQNGRIVGSRVHPSEEMPDGLIRDTLEVVLHEAGEGEARVLGRFGTSERVVGARDLMEGVLIREPFPFARPALVAAEGTRTVVGLTDRFELRVFDGEGELEHVIRVEAEPVPVTDEVMKEYVDLRMNGGMQREDGRGGADALQEREMRLYRENRMALPRVTSLPHFEGLGLAESGSIWIGDYIFPLSRPAWVRWWEITPDGEAGRAIELPAVFRFMYASSSHLLGVLPDELGVERVVRFELPGH